MMSGYHHHSATTDLDLIVADGKKFPIHKLLLADGSSTFVSLIGELEFKESNDASKETARGHR